MMTVTYALNVREIPLHWIKVKAYDAIQDHLVLDVSEYMIRKHQNYFSCIKLLGYVVPTRTGCREALILMKVGRLRFSDSHFPTPALLPFMLNPLV